MAFATADILDAGMESRAAEDARRSRAFAAARRHSLLVRVLRLVLKTGAVAAVLLAIALSLYNMFGRPLQEMSVGSVGVEGTKVTMDSPRLTGYRKDGNPYLVNAAKAVQDVLHPTIVELSGIDANITSSDKGAINLSARSGVYDTTAEHLDVSDDVRIKSSQYLVTMQSASVDFKSGVYSSNDPVSIVTSNGMTVNADSVTANDNGRELQFKGNVRTLFQPAPDAAPSNGIPQ
jgi:lipopolysaccharide export system protein LptC